LHAWRDRSGLGVAIGVGAAIFVTLYTTLFTNIHGLFTGTVATNGTLLYWLGQQGERRGEQPWFYYLLLMPQYEFVAVLLGGAGVLLTAVVAARALRGRPAGPRFFLRAFLAVWFVGLFVALSYAGEKMPWLVVHLSLPATLLAASLIGEAAERAVAWRRTLAPAAGAGRPRPAFGRPEMALAAALLVVGGCWLLLAARLSYGTFVPSTDVGGWERAVTAHAAERWWWLALPPLAAVLLLAVGWVWRGPRRTGAAAVGAVALGLVLLQLHAGWRTSYQEADVPKDMLIYTQTAPDVHRMVAELGALSAAVTGGKDLAIWYDDGVSWPMQWYLRDFDDHYYRALAGPPTDAAVVLAQVDRRGAVEPFLEGYTAQEYVLRWWFPEYPIYRNFALAPELNPGTSAWKTSDQPHGLGDVVASVFDSLATQLEPAGQQRVYRLLMYRDLPARIDSYRYVLYVRNDLVPLFNQIRYGL
jgi:predicted membrane-bound mannosyltransferase